MRKEYFIKATDDFGAPYIGVIGREREYFACLENATKFDSVADAVSAISRLSLGRSLPFSRDNEELTIKAVEIVNVLQEREVEL